ncbi:hypothetical protein WOLCODRAFT_142042 [Wolfiporia cocos MD-104 SS10]|uniref:DUF6534 domain-containing protein n=1 Tax=Wolfiporia cocos (strain MD-104) TaxID=742152 RepID=A0A2H3IXR3_WOLCO|nr:hypothetical protein WOLCODRAFT_142042 [Wolfiporia cocos MD-104 SS10]
MDLSNTLLNNTLGCTFIGVLFAVMFYGFGCAQTQYYFRHYPEDRIYLKAFVGFLWVLDTVRTILDVEYLWFYVIEHHGDPNGLSDFPSAFLAEFFLAALTIVVVQLYFIQTIWDFMKGKWYRLPVSFTMTALALLSFAGGTASVWEFTKDTEVALVLKNATVTASIQTVTAFVADIYIAISLSSILNGKRTGFSRTDNLITKLVAYAIHRGIFTALMQLLHFATFIGTLKDGPTKLIWSLFHFPGSKIYVNSLLALLNVRQHLRENKETRRNSGGIQLQEIFAQRSGTQTISRQDASHTRIVITTEVIHDEEIDMDLRRREKV